MYYVLNKKSFLLPVVSGETQSQQELQRTLLSIATVFNDVVQSIVPMDNMSLPTHSDNVAAKAAGMTAGMWYKTLTGQVMIVY